jgi:hypothetical protein
VRTSGLDTTSILRQKLNITVPGLSPIYFYEKNHFEPTLDEGMLLGTQLYAAQDSFYLTKFDGSGNAGKLTKVKMEISDAVRSGCTPYKAYAGNVRIKPINAPHLAWNFSPDADSTFRFQLSSNTYEIDFEPFGYEPCDSSIFTLSDPNGSEAKLNFSVSKKASRAEQADPNHHFSVLPNPSSGHFSINNSSDVQKMRLYNMQGVVIFEANQPNQQPFYTNFKGLALLVMQTEHGQFVRQMIFE